MLVADNVEHNDILILHRQFEIGSKVHEFCELDLMIYTSITHKVVKDLSKRFIWFASEPELDTSLERFLRSS